MSNGSNGPARRVSPKDIQVVQNLIERCLQLYMNRREVVETLLVQAKIEPGFTELVWQKLEEENREFFKAYYLRLMVTNQIKEFNKLLKQQLQLMHQINSSMSTSNRSHVIPMHQDPQCYTPEHMVPDVNYASDCSLQNAFNNGGSSLLPSVHSIADMSAHASRIDVASAMIPMQSSNMSSIQGLNGGIMKSEAGYPVASQYMLGPDRNVLNAHTLVDTTSSFRIIESESESEALHEPFLGSDVPELEQLGQFSRTLSFSDLAADFAHSSDLLGNYTRSHYLLPENGNFMNSQEGENQGDTKRPDDDISKGMS